MIDYNFYFNKIGTPQFSVKGSFEGLSELGSCKFEYLKDIILKLQQVSEGTLNTYSFGVEVYSIACDKDQAKIINTYDNWQVEGVVKTAEVLDMMTKWLNFSENWYLNKHEI